MQSATLLVLLLVVVAAAGGAWLLLGGSSVGVETENDEPFPELVPSEPIERPEPPTQRPSVVVQPPTEPSRPRIAVLAEGEELPEEAGHAAAMNALHETRLGDDPGSREGRELVQAVARVAYLRFRKEADLRELQQLGPDAEWPPDLEIRLVEVVEHWRRSGFEVEPRGLVLLVTRHEE